MQYENIHDLHVLVADKFVTARKHPKFDLWIYNYSPRAQGLPVKEWSQALKDSRGLVLDEMGYVWARPFSKFWNYEQVLDQIPNDLAYTIWEKMDGSLGIVFGYAGEVVVATRGSFESDQAKWAAKWLESNHPNFFPESNQTWLFEIIFPENRIVVDYGDKQGLVLLAIRMADTGIIFSPTSAMAGLNAFKKAALFGSSSLPLDVATTAGGIQENQEGYVIRWRNGFQAKIKSEEYKRLHRLITQCSTRTIWELLSSGKDTSEIIDRVPDDFRDWVLGKISGLRAHYNHITNEAVAAMENYRSCNETRAQFAEYAKKFSNPGLIFALYDGKDISAKVWKLVEPAFATPFRRESEN